MVFPVKFRKSFLDEEVIRIIRATAAGIEERYKIDIETMGMDKNHIHVVCGAHPKLSPGRIVKIFKSITAREIFELKPSVKKHLWGGEFWTNGYYVSTVGKRAD
jgi:putative transposase